MIPALLAGVMTSTTLYAGDSDWKFHALLDTARASYPQIAARQRSLDAAKADVDAAEWQRFPVPGIQTSMDDQGNLSDRVFSLQQPIWTGGRVTAGIEAAEARRGMADMSVMETDRSVVQRLIGAYGDARRRQNQREIHRENLVRHQGLRDIIQRRVQSKISPDVDLNLAMSRLYQAENELSSSEQALTVALMRLSELTGRTVKGVDVSEKIDLSGLPDTLKTAVEQATAALPALRKIDFELVASQADVDSAKAAFWPQVTVRMEYVDGKQVSEQRTMLTLGSQLGAGLSSRANVNAALSRKDALAEDRKVTVAQLETTVVESWYAFAGARYRLSNTHNYRDRTLAIFESYTRLYAAGQKSWLDVMNAARELVSSALAVEDTEAEKLNAALGLLLLTGKL